MKKTKIASIAVVFLGLCLVTCQSQAATVLFGTPGSGGNAFPFGGGVFASTRYQQVYDNALFPSGPILISDITFFNSGRYSIKSSTYTVHLSTSVNPVNGLDTTTLSNNVGADDALFGVFPLSGNPGPTFTLSGAPFFYDPSNGDLLVDITTPSNVGIVGYFDAMNGSFGADSSRAHDYGTVFESWGLVTQFTYSPASDPVVPEPASLTIFGIGALGFVVTRLRRRVRAE